MNTMLCYVVICLSVLISVNCHLHERARESIVKRFGKCLEEFNLTPEDFVKTRDLDLDPCFMACYFKDAQIMNDKGMLDLEQANKISESLDDGLVRMLKRFPELCKDVNEKEVSDGDKGCERAKMITECIAEAGRKMHLARTQNKD